jgi:hypothetical protein
MAHSFAVIEFEPSERGIREAQAELDAWSRRMQGDPSLTPSARVATSNGAVSLYEHIGEHSQTRRLLEILPAGLGATPSELGQLLNEQQPRTAASVRAMLRNLGRAESTLITRGSLPGRVLNKDFAKYHAEGAGRFSISEADRTALDAYLASQESS